MAEHTKKSRDKYTHDKHTKVRAGTKGKNKPNFTPNPNKRNKANAILLALGGGSIAYFADDIYKILSSVL